MDIAASVLSRITHSRLFKFLCVGVSGTGIDFMLFYLSYEQLEIPLVVSNIISYGTGLTTSFFLNRAWTFRDSVQRSHKRLVLAWVIGYLGLAINTLMVWSLAYIMPVFAGKMLAVIVVIVYNYLTNKYIIFGIK